MFDFGEKEESTAKIFKRRKRNVVKEKNDPCRGFRDVLGCAIVFAEFESAKRDVRQVSFDKALFGFIVDPVEWGNGHIALGNLFVLWASPDGQYHIDGATLRSLMIMIMWWA